MASCTLGTRLAMRAHRLRVFYGQKRFGSWQNQLFSALIQALISKRKPSTAVLARRCLRYLIIFRVDLKAVDSVSVILITLLSSSPWEMTTDAQPGFQILSSSNPDLRIRDYKKQRPHRKSRSGCLPCKVKKVKVCNSFSLSLPVYRSLHGISVTSVNQFANDAEETEDNVYMASLMTVNMNTALLAALRLRASPQSLWLLILTPVRRMVPLVFNFYIISIQIGMTYSIYLVVMS